MSDCERAKRSANKKLETREIGGRERQEGEIYREGEIMSERGKGEGEKEDWGRRETGE
jgi:hypothetical protein